MSSRQVSDLSRLDSSNGSIQMPAAVGLGDVVDALLVARSEQRLPPEGEHDLMRQQNLDGGADTEQERAQRQDRPDVK